MKQDLQDKAVEILTQIQSGVQAGADFAAREIPEIAWSYVLYGRVWYTFAVLATVAAMVACAFGYRKVLQMFHGGMEPEAALIGLFLAIPSTITTFAFFESAKSAALVWLAPKLWLIKEIVGLVK